jgi:hypothetical protein
MTAHKTIKILVKGVVDFFSSDIRKNNSRVNVIIRVKREKLNDSDIKIESHSANEGEKANNRITPAAIGLRIFICKCRHKTNTNTTHEIIEIAAWAITTDSNPG